MDNVILRGKTYYARYRVPEARWADVGQAMSAAGGIKREVVRTLGTSDPREARRLRHGAIALIQSEIDQALRKIGKPPLTDWTAAWMDRAVAHRADIESRGSELLGYHPQADEFAPPEAVTNSEIIREIVETEAEQVAARRGPDVARQFLNVALGDGLTVAEGKRRWLATQTSRKAASIKGHEAAFRKLEAFLEEHKGWASLECVRLEQVTRRLAGEFLAHCCTLTKPATVKREASAYNGVWRWAMRRGYTDVNPWFDQTAGLSARQNIEGTEDSSKRGYTSDELIALLRAGVSDLAPNKGGYAATFWDLLRLLMLTGARPGEILGLRVMDVIAGGAAVALAAHSGGGKTKNAKRIMPLHSYAAAVISARLASLPNTAPEASLWPEVPAQGGDKSRAKTVTTRFPAIRRRLLPASAGVDLYSLRRSFQTAAETAKNANGRLDAGVIARLAGQRQGHLALDVYSDWSRLGRPQLSGELTGRLRTLADAVDDVVALGFSDEIRKALEDTAGSRPAVVRTAPAFSRLGLEGRN